MAGQMVCCLSWLGMVSELFEGLLDLLCMFFFFALSQYLYINSRPTSSQPVIRKRP